ncbi:epidermal patterning factor 2-like protein [Trifolium pratense]|uniref:Epidermal patterning factor-like protein n=1 Tax=Trifolium pratense TaxID=57577 RepID=A0A2K3N257_TRIPR|nr:epidermal patterning factor 2-like protein [Trifolium pratense]PNX97140.1 epidermal patterning factor 2-like protein [Trifolium pratense]
MSMLLTWVDPGTIAPTLLIESGKLMGLQDDKASIRDKKDEARQDNAGMELYPTGSTIPDCSHACGPCSPCKRVMVGFSKCSMAESCPIVYRCICKGKYYHVPSN